MVDDRMLILSDSNFNEALSEANTLVLVDFWAEWCGPCKMFSPVIEEIAKEFEGQVKVGKLNVDENQDIPASLKIVSIPTVILFKEGKEVERSIGFKTKEELRNLLKKYL